MDLCRPLHLAYRSLYEDKAVDNHQLEFENHVQNLQEYIILLNYLNLKKLNAIEEMF